MAPMKSVSSAVLCMADKSPLNDTAWLGAATGRRYGDWNQAGGEESGVTQCRASVEERERWAVWPRRTGVEPRYRGSRQTGAELTGTGPAGCAGRAARDHRYVVCFNEEEARKDAHDREAIVAALRTALAHGDKGLVGNKGYRRFLTSQGTRFAIDEAKVDADARYDGLWVLHTNTTLAPRYVALAYKQLWMVEAIFRSIKSVLDHSCPVIELEGAHNPLIQNVLYAILRCDDIFSESSPSQF